MPQTRMRVRKTVAQKVPMDKLQGIFFANQFQLTDPAKSYKGIKYAIEKGSNHTTLRMGVHNFSMELAETKKFLGLLEWYERKDKIELRNVTIVETGINSREAKPHHFEVVEETLMRIVINVRDDDTTGQVGLGVTIGGKKGEKIHTWMTTSSSYATVIPGCCSELTIPCNNEDIPTLRQKNNKSIYVIMDIMPKKDTQYITADKIMEQTNTSKEQLIAQLKKLQKEGKISIEQLQEMLKDPEGALGKMTGEENTHSQQKNESSDTGTPTPSTTHNDTADSHNDSITTQEAK